jgi:hypothetical protein
LRGVFLVFRRCSRMWTVGLPRRRTSSWRAGPTTTRRRCTSSGTPPRNRSRVMYCDASGFHPEYLTLMRRSTVLTLVKRWSTWAITSKTSPTTPNDPFWSTLVNPWSNPTQNPLNTPLPSSVSQNFCRVLQISPKHFKISQCKSCVFCRGTQFSC